MHCNVINTKVEDKDVTKTILDDWEVGIKLFSICTCGLFAMTFCRSTRAAGKIIFSGVGNSAFNS